MNNRTAPAIKRVLIPVAGFLAALGPVTGVSAWEEPETETVFEVRGSVVYERETYAYSHEHEPHGDHEPGIYGVIEPRRIYKRVRPVPVTYSYVYTRPAYYLSPGNGAYGDHHGGGLSGLWGGLLTGGQNNRHYRAGGSYFAGF